MRLSERILNKGQLVDENETETGLFGITEEEHYEIERLEAENERLQTLVDIDHTYGHLYLVAMRKLKEHSEELYWELFDKTCQHFDALLAGKETP